MFCRILFQGADIEIKNDTAKKRNATIELIKIFLTQD